MRFAVGTSFLASALIQAVNVGTGVLLARTLGVVGRGELAALLLWPMLITSIGALGATEAVTYFAAAGRSRLADLVKTSRTLWLCQSVVCALLVFGAALIVVGRWGAPVSYALLAVAFVPVYLATNYGVALLQGVKAFSAFNAIRLAVPSVTAVCLVALAASGRLGVGAALVSYIVTYALVGLIAAVLVRRRIDGPATGTGLTRPVLSYGIRSHVSFVATTVNERLDQTVIALFLAPAMLGLYVVAGTLTSLTTLVASTAALIALPVIAALPEGTKRDGEIVRLVRLATAGAVAASGVIFVMTPVLLRVFFGHAFQNGAVAARVLLAAAIFLAVGRLLAAVLRGLNQPLRAGIGDGVGVAVTLVALPSLLPTVGLTGAAIASLAGYGASALWMGRQVRRSLSEPRPLLLPAPGELSMARAYLRGRMSVGRAEA